MPSHYKHDIDIRSSQLGRAAKDAKDRISRIISSFFILICLFSIYTIYDNNKSNEKKENDLSRAILNAPRLNPSIVASDYVNNRMRYQDQWQSKWHKFSGKIASIRNERVIFDAGWISTPQSRGERASVICEVPSERYSEFAKFNSGDHINITGKLRTEFNGSRGMNGVWEFVLYQCQTR